MTQTHATIHGPQLCGAEVTQQMKRNFTTVVPGFYRTRGNEIAEVVQITDTRLKDLYPARGFIGRHGDEWTLAGSELTVAGFESPEDLIEYLGTEKPRESPARMETLTRWANIYEGGDVATFATRKRADRRADPGRIACVELTGEYEVGVNE